MLMMHPANLDESPDTLAAWLDELCDELGWSERQNAYHLLRETLHATRDLLRIDEAVIFATRLPYLVRRLYFDGWDPSGGVPLGSFSRENILAKVDTSFAWDPSDDPERAIAAVFDLVSRHGSGEQDYQMRRSG